MVTKIQQWGNSLGLRIPKTFADEVHIRKGTAINLAIADGRLLITIVKKPHQKYNLRNLLTKIKRSNIHAEVETGSQIGQEIW